MAHFKLKITLPKLCLTVGLWNILFAFLSFIYYYDSGGEYIESYGISAFETMLLCSVLFSLFQEITVGGILFGLASLLSMLVLVFSFFMVVCGLIMLLREKGKRNFCDASVTKPYTFFKTIFFLNFLFAISILACFAAMLILTFVSEKRTVSGFYPGLGVWLTLLLAIVTRFLFKRFCLMNEKDAEKSTVVFDLKMTAPRLFLKVGVFNLFCLFFDFLSYFTTDVGFRMTDRISAYRLISDGLQMSALSKFSNYWYVRYAGFLDKSDVFLFIVAVLLILFFLFSLFLTLTGGFMLLKNKRNIKFGDGIIQKAEKSLDKILLADFLLSVTACGLCVFPILFNLKLSVNEWEGICPGIGYWLILIASIVLFKLSRKGNLDSDETEENCVYRCITCGTVVKKTDKACANCGASFENKKNE